MTELLDARAAAVALPPAPVRAAGAAATAPTYVYDVDLLRERCAAVAAALPLPKRLFFATMANDHPAVLDGVRAAGLGVFVNSRAHLDLALGLGFAPDRVVYAASNMERADLAAVVRSGAHLVLDSAGQLAALTEVAEGVSVGLRVNVGSALRGDGLRPDPEYRFGVLPEELPAAVRLAASRGVSVAGAHAYFGTDVMRPEVLLAGLDRLAAAAAVLPDLRYVDVGGGFGVPDRLGEPEFDLAAYGEGAAATVRKHEERQGRPILLYAEPGRYLAAPAGFFYVRVVDRKPRSDRVLVGTNGSVALFPRPLLYPDRARHPCQVAGREAEPPGPLPVWVCGNSTYSQDFLARELALPVPDPGESLVFHNAGAYGRSMATRFLGRDPAAEVVV